MKHPFDYHRPSEAQVEKITIFRDACKALHKLIEDYAPSGRERAIAITKLEETSMWLNKAVIMVDEGPVDDNTEEIGMLVSGQIDVNETLEHSAMQAVGYANETGETVLMIRGERELRVTASDRIEGVVAAWIKMYGDDK